MHEGALVKNLFKLWGGSGGTSVINVLQRVLCEGEGFLWGYGRFRFW